MVACCGDCLLLLFPVDVRGSVFSLDLSDDDLIAIYPTCSQEQRDEIFAELESRVEIYNAEGRDTEEIEAFLALHL